MGRTIYLLLISFILFSCSDAEVVSGTYKGKFYGTDTVDATGKISIISDSYVGIEISSSSMPTIYSEHAQILKNSDLSYNLFLKTNDSTLILSGHYYDGFMHINAISSGYIFEGKK